MIECYVKYTSRTNTVRLYLKYSPESYAQFIALIHYELARPPQPNTLF